MFEKEVKELKETVNNGCEEINKATRKMEKEAKKVWSWVKENPREALILATGTFTAVAAMFKGAAKFGDMIQDASEKKDMDRRIWNPVAGEYLYTKKPLTGKQKLEFESRIQSGEPRAEILNSMGVLDKKR